MEIQIDTEKSSVLDVVREMRVATEKEVADAKTGAAPENTGTTGDAGESKGAPVFKALSADDQGVIIGIGGSVNVDADDEAVAQRDLIRAAHDFCASKGRAFKANHEDALGADLVASWVGAPILKGGRVLKKGEALPDDESVVGINIEKGRETHWFAAIRPHDPEVLKAAKEGKIAGLSWGGYCNKTDGE